MLLSGAHHIIKDHINTDKHQVEDLILSCITLGLKTSPHVIMFVNIVQVGFGYMVGLIA